jgi:small multidrug resistance pump
MSYPPSAYISLVLAIACEVLGTSMLKQSEQFTRLVPSVITTVSYIASFYLLSIAIKTIPVAIVYAVWSAVGIVAISIVGVVFFKQSLDYLGILGLALIAVGVVFLNLSKTVPR